MSTQTARSSSGPSFVPTSRLFWGLVVIGIVMFVFGAFQLTGVLAGMFGIWGASLVVSTIFGYAVLKLWAVLAN